MQIDFHHFAAQLTYLTPGELHDVRSAFDFAIKAHEGQKREDGAPYVMHCIAVAEIIASWKGDRDTIIAALLHDVLEDTSIKRDELAEKFGRHVILLVEGITKFAQADLSPDLPLDRKIETLRKLFDVMRLDMRVVMIKLADRLHNVRTIGTLPSPERRRRFALETLNIYYKLSFHLGLRAVRREFAELCVPHAFDCGAEDMAMRDRMCDAAKDVFSALQHELLSTEAKDRILKVYQLSRNLLIFHNRRIERGGDPIAEDAFSINIVVREEEDCYYLLKILHTLHRPVSGRFRDFIAAPSDAGYRSLHTNVALKDGSVVEVRIRTPEMEDQALKGISLLIFGGNQKESSYFSWLQRTESLDLKTRENSSAFWEALESDILRETIALTVDRRRLSLPKDATVLDAAYAVYNERASHAKVFTVNGRAVQPGECLKEDDEVHITFDEQQQASFDWLQLVSTHHARFHIVEILKQTSRSEKITLGANLLQKELDHYNKGLLSGLSRTQCQHVADHFKRQTFDEVLAMVGEGVIRARDVVFYLYPDHQRKHLFSFPSKRYAFRLHVTVTLKPGQDVLSQLNGVIRLSDVSVEDVHVRRDDQLTTDIYLTGTSSDRLHFADFIDALERQEWVSEVSTVLSKRQKAFIATLFSLALGVIVLDLTLLGRYEDALTRLSSAALILAFVLPLLPILLANYYLLSYLKSYVVRLRKERWYFGLGFFLNMFGIVLVTWKLPLLRTGSAVLVVLALFAVAMLLLGYRFAETYLLLDSSRQASSDVVTTRNKLVGYLLRFGAVFIWGIEPVLIRYTSLQQLSPLLRVNIWAVAGAVSGFGAIAFLNLFRSQKDRLAYTTPYNRYFWIIVIANLSYNYFLHRSLLFTTATNVNLVLSYAPVFALLLGFVIWRDRISYFSSAKSIQQMFMVFALSALGGTLLIYNDSFHGGGGVLGDLFALLIAFSDVAFIMSNIHYVKYSNKATNTISLATHHFVWIAIVTFVIIGILNLFGLTSISYDITPMQWLTGIGVGVLTLLGLVLTFEAFRRIDGLLAFLMLNLAPFIAFTAEILFVDPTTFGPLFILGGATIISASILAEVVNSRCQKKAF